MDDICFNRLFEDEVRFYKGFCKIIEDRERSFLDDMKLRSQLNKNGLIFLIVAALAFLSTIASLGICATMEKPYIYFQFIWLVVFILSVCCCAQSIVHPNKISKLLFLTMASIPISHELIVIVSIWYFVKIGKPLYINQFIQLGFSSYLIMKNRVKIADYWMKFTILEK